MKAGMAEVHQLVLRHGREAAREMLPREQRHLVDIAAEMLADDAQTFNVTYSGFCLTGLPHRSLPDDAIWTRTNGRVTLSVTPGYLPHRGVLKRYGVPYGSRARLILFYLQTEAIKRNSREVELGRSMAQWLERMGIPVGGKAYADVREQASRISACHLLFTWDTEKGKDAYKKEGIVTEGIRLHDLDARQGSLWDERVTLTETFWKALKDHPVPVSEQALRLIGGKSLAIDILIWLSFRLHSLTKPTLVPWPALHLQFGSERTALKHFKPDFSVAVRTALAAYPQARVDIEAEGLLLHPSPPPVLRLEG